jgi:hypothetical protein
MFGVLDEWETFGHRYRLCRAHVRIEGWTPLRPADANEAGRREFPCSWLRAVQRYAGTGPASFARILATAREIVEIGKLPKLKTTPGEIDDTTGDEEPEASEPEPPKGKKPRKRPAAAVAIQAAFERVRKRL